ncbi:MAG: sporulation protein [Oscillospiraceae bacterium]|nr:sporulation protein [Oscillospiraceae bacterium]
MTKMTPRRIRRVLPLLCTLLLFALLMLYSAPAAAAAKQALVLCAQVLIPSLLPFFVLSGLLSALGLSRALNRAAAPLMQKLFSVSGAGAAAFLLGLTGGYPLGAASVKTLYQRQELSEPEAKRLVCFCNNSGPAFIVGAAGSGVFGSAKAGLILYLSHLIAAVLVGLLFSVSGRKAAQKTGKTVSPSPISDFSAAFPEAVSSAVRSTLLICGYVVFFSVFVGLLDALGIFSAFSGLLASHTPLSIGQSRAILTGLLELGSGVGALHGQSYAPGNLALCAFLLGWGGVSVLFQTRAVLAGTPLAKAPLARSKLLHGLFSAPIAAALCILLR